MADSPLPLAERSDADLPGHWLLARLGKRVLRPGGLELTTRLLHETGIPVPRSATVRSEDEAVRAANRIGYPVVIKPLDGNHGRGVCINLKNEAEVRKHPFQQELPQRVFYRDGGVGDW